MFRPLVLRLVTLFAAVALPLVVVGVLTEDDDAVQFQVESGSESTQMVYRPSYIEICVRPSTARLSHPAILDVARRDTGIFQGIGHRSEVSGSRVLGLEAPAVYEHRDRMRGSCRRQSKLAVLTRIFPICQAVIRITTRQRLELHRAH